MASIFTSGGMDRRLHTRLLWGGAGMLAAAACVDPIRAWANLLVASYFLLTLCLGGVLFLALTAVSGARWHLGIRHIPLELARWLPIVSLVFVVIVALRLPSYGWHHEGGGDPGTFWFKEWWLKPQFLGLRGIVVVVLWGLLAWAMTGRSGRSGVAAAGQRDPAVGTAAWFLAIYAVTFSLASVDWLMALEPLWFSTVWGVYCFAGMVESTLAALIVIGLTLSGREPSSCAMRRETLHDLGQLLLGFACFWMYIWFCQYMLIWYSNLPEETSFIAERTRGAWGAVTLVCMLLNWLVPFFCLLPKGAKQSRSVMLKVAVAVLVGRWVDLYVIVFPSVLGGQPTLGVWEIAALSGLLGCCGTILGRGRPVHQVGTAYMPPGDSCQLHH